VERLPDAQGSKEQSGVRQRCLSRVLHAHPTRIRNAGSGKPNIEGSVVEDLGAGSPTLSIA